MELAVSLDLWREKPEVCLRAGRDALRLLVELAPTCPEWAREVETLRRGASAPPAPTWEAMWHQRTPTKCLLSVLPKELEQRVLFLLTKVNRVDAGPQLQAFFDAFLAAPERELALADVARFLCVVVQPKIANVLQGSPLLPRGALLALLLRLLRQPRAIEATRVALLCDWWTFRPGDDVLAIEPTVSWIRLLSEAVSAEMPDSAERALRLLDLWCDLLGVPAASSPTQPALLDRILPPGPRELVSAGVASALAALRISGIVPAPESLWAAVGLDRCPGLRTAIHTRLLPALALAGNGVDVGAGSVSGSSFGSASPSRASPSPWSSAMSDDSGAASPVSLTSSSRPSSAAAPFLPSDGTPDASATRTASAPTPSSSPSSPAHAAPSSGATSTRKRGRRGSVDLGDEPGGVAAGESHSSSSTLDARARHWHRFLDRSVRASRAGPTESDALDIALPPVLVPLQPTCASVASALTNRRTAVEHLLRLVEDGESHPAKAGKVDPSRWSEAVRHVGEAQARAQLSWAELFDAALPSATSASSTVFASASTGTTLGADARLPLHSLRAYEEMGAWTARVQLDDWWLGTLDGGAASAPPVADAVGEWRAKAEAAEFRSRTLSTAAPRASLLATGGVSDVDALLDRWIDAVLAARSDSLGADERPLLNPSPLVIALSHLLFGLHTELAGGRSSDGLMHGVSEVKSESESVSSLAASLSSSAPSSASPSSSSSSASPPHSSSSSSASSSSLSSSSSFSSSSSSLSSSASPSHFSSSTSSSFSSTLVSTTSPSSPLGLRMLLRCGRRAPVGVHDPFLPYWVWLTVRTHHAAATAALELTGPLSVSLTADELARALTQDLSAELDVALAGALAGVAGMLMGPIAREAAWTAWRTLWTAMVAAIAEPRGIVTFEVILAWWTCEPLARWVAGSARLDHRGAWRALATTTRAPFLVDAVTDSRSVLHEALRQWSPWEVDGFLWLADLSVPHDDREPITTALAASLVDSTNPRPTREVVREWLFRWGVYVEEG